MNRSFGLKSLVDPRRGEFPKLVVDPAWLARIQPKCDYSYIYPTVDNQGPFGTCVAFGTGKVFEFFYRKRKGVPIDISKRALYSEIKRTFYPGDTQDDGAQVSDGLKILEKHYVLESDFPYDTSNFLRCLDGFNPSLEHTDFEFKDFVAVESNVDAMRLALYKHGPLAIGIDWQNEWMEPDSTGRLKGSGTTSAGGHCVSIVGYNDDFVNLDGSKGAFHIINNWSAEWAHQGFAWLPYNSQTLPSDIFTVAA